MWLYSTASVLLYLPVVAWIVWTTRPQFTPVHWGAFIASGVLHMANSLVLQAGLFDEHHRAPRAGVLYGLATGIFIASYTVNDGWAVKVLLISPFIVDWGCNVFRTVFLAPAVWLDRARMLQECRQYARPVAIVGVLGPLGYILVLYAMQLAPIGHVAPARELSTLVGTWFGARLLREKAGQARMAGAACIVAGVVSLALAGG